MGSKTALMDQTRIRFDVQSLLQVILYIQNVRWILGNLIQIHSVILRFEIIFLRMQSINGIRVYFEHNWHKRGVLRLWRYWIRNKMYSEREKVWWHQWLFWWVGWRYQYLWWVFDLIAHYRQKYWQCLQSHGLQAPLIPWTIWKRFELHGHKVMDTN